MHSRSVGPNPCRRVTKYPLFRMLRWVRVAPFGNPVVPDVYWMLIGSSGRSRRRAARRARASVDPAGAGDELVPVVLPEEHRPLEAGHLRQDLLDHVDVVRRLERRSGEQHAAARLVEGEGQLVRAVRRVDVDQDHADLRRGVLHQRPLGVVRAPQADAVARLQPEPDQAAGEPGDPLGELRVGPPHALVAGDEGFAVAVLGDGPGEVAPIVSSSSGTSVGPASCASSIATSSRGSFSAATSAAW